MYMAAEHRAYNKKWRGVRFWVPRPGASSQRVVSGQLTATEDRCAFYLLKRAAVDPVHPPRITLITFLVMKTGPGGPAQVLRAQASGGNVQATETNKKAMEAMAQGRHLDKPLMVQYGYWLWGSAPLRPPVDRSCRPDKVATIIFDRMWITIILNMIAFAMIYSIAIPIGILGAAKQFTIWDRLTTIIPFILYSLPSSGWDADDSPT